MGFLSHARGFRTINVTFSLVFSQAEVEVIDGMYQGIAPEQDPFQVTKSNVLAKDNCDNQLFQSRQDHCALCPPRAKLSGERNS